MAETPLTLTDLALVATVAGAVFAGLRLLADYIKSKVGPKQMTNAEQSAQCQFDHKELGAILAAQNANIAKMLQQNGEQIKALADANHAAQLRHQIVLNEFDKTRNEIEKLRNRKD